MTDSNSAAQSATNPYGSTKTAYYALGILTIVYSINFIDRQLLSILQEAIKADLMLSDAQLGLLTDLHLRCFTLLLDYLLPAWRIVVTDEILWRSRSRSGVA